MRRRWILVPSLALGGALALALMPPRTRHLVARPRPAAHYAEAIERIVAIQAQDSQAINPVCGTIALTHGRKVARSFVLLHGFTSCPRQFRELAERLHALGHNVLVPRMPYHGLADLMSRAQARLTASELARFVDASVDIAQGLGERVTVAGLSAGGVMAAWAGQQRADVELAVVMSPALGIRALSARRNAQLTNMLLRLPNQFRWWDEQTKDQIVRPSYAYPRLSSRALGEIMRLGAAVWRQARQRPAAGKILVITNPSDLSVNNALTDALVERWRASGARDIQTYAFDADLKLIHDFIDPRQSEQQVERVYPVLLELLAG